MLYKSLLICLLTLIISVPTVLADIQPWSMPTQIAMADIPKNTSPLFERIAKCESGNVATAKNAYSSASGRFQFLWSSWYHYGKELWGDDFYTKNIWDYNDNTELAWYVFSTYGSSPWNSSKSCWLR